MKKYFMKKKLVFFAASRAAGKGSPAGGSATWRVFFLLLLLLCLPLSAAADDEEGSMPPTDGDRILLGSIGEASNLIPYLTADSASHEVADLLYVAPLRFNKDLEPECWAAEELLLDESNAQDGNYAFVCEKCAPTFEYYGWFMTAEELKRRSDGIYERT